MRWCPSDADGRYPGGPERQGAIPNSARKGGVSSIGTLAPGFRRFRRLSFPTWDVKQKFLVPAGILQQALILWRIPHLWESYSRKFRGGKDQGNGNTCYKVRRICFWPFVKVGSGYKFLQK